MSLIMKMSRRGCLAGASKYCRCRHHVLWNLRRSLDRLQAILAQGSVEEPWRRSHGLYTPRGRGPFFKPVRDSHLDTFVISSPSCIPGFSFGGTFRGQGKSKSWLSLNTHTHARWIIHKFALGVKRVQLLLGIFKRMQRLNMHIFKL